MTPAIDIFRAEYAATENIARALEAVYAAGMRRRARKGARTNPYQTTMDIFRAACHNEKVNMRDIRSRDRDRKSANARARVWARMVAAGVGFKECGRATGHNHATVIAALRKLEKRT
jgi:chromosomal replication initiation ATPase DnaA